MITLRTAQYWHERAEEVRVIAETMVETETKRTMIAIAKGYDRLAEHHRKRAERSMAEMLRAP